MSAREWPWATLDEVATVTAGNPAPQGAEFFEGGSRPFVRVQDLGRLNGAAHLTETADLVNDRAAGTLKLFPKGSVLFTKSGASLLLNQRAILGRDMHVVSHIGVAVPGPRITSEWLYYWLRTIDFADIAHGANMPSLPLARVKQVRLPVPPVPEQRRRVAEIEKQFSRLDEAVANLKRGKANLKRYKAAVLKAAVEGRLVPTEAELAHREGRSFETGAQLLQRIGGTGPQLARAAALGGLQTANAGQHLCRLPEVWALATVGELASLVDYGSSAKTSESIAGIPVLRMGNIVDGRIDIADLKFLPEFHGEFPRLLLQPGDLLFNRTNSLELVGKAAVYKGKPDKCSFASYLIRVRLRDGCLPEFLSAFVNSIYGRRWVKGVVTQQVGQANVNGTKLKNLQIPVPPAAEQARIVQEMERQLSMIWHCETLIEELTSRAVVQRCSLLSRAFAADA